MAIIVDKVQKRKDIALSSKELIFENGINNLTVAQVAKSAGVGKGTIYEYFNNKEEIVFELVNILMQKHNDVKIKKLSNISSAQEKIKVFFEFFYVEEDIELRAIYKEFISITLTTTSKDMLEFQTTCYNLYYKWIEEIIEDGIKNEELIPHARELIKGLFAFAQGMFLMNEVTYVIKDLEKELNFQIDILFELIKVKK